MAVTQTEYDSIVKYLTEQMLLDKEGSYEEWKSQKTKKKRTKPEGYLAEEWEAFWNQWPSMRTFEYQGQKFICNKPFKKNEELLREKYNRIIDSKEVTVEQLQYAAKVFLTNTMADSVRKGKNEMEYVSGMEPWLNQKQWRNWMNVKLPEIQEVEDYKCA